jgi:two-component system cell cycle response regulator DivK
MARHVSPDVPTVLLVDSAHDDRAMYAEYLRVCGLNPVEVDNTADALTRATTADVVVTGIRVQGPFDGVELVRRLRNDNGSRDKPIIVLTACTFEPDQQRALSAGCDVFLAKPCLPERLVSDIRVVLSRRRVPKTRPARAPKNDHRNRRAS